MVGEREENLKKKHIHTKRLPKQSFLCIVKKFQATMSLVSVFQELEQEP